MVVVDVGHGESIVLFVFLSVSLAGEVYAWEEVRNCFKNDVSSLRRVTVVVMTVAMVVMVMCSGSPLCRQRRIP